MLACFEQLAAIPRPSHHEEKIGAFLLDWAKERGFAADRDAAGNVIFDVPATPGREGAPLVALQAHMDMVAVSDDPAFDPLNTPIRTVRDETTLTADGTSLGADDGIGVATILYLVSSQAEHGPLRVIFTACEEDGMTGMFGMDAAVVADVQYLLNLDAETLGEAVVSTAAGVIVTLSQPPRRTAPTLDTALALRLDGLKGGHSGVMIDKGRANAVQHLADLLLALRDEGVAYELSAFAGGVAPNAIPDSAEALVVVAAADAPRVEALAAERGRSLAAAYRDGDPELAVSVAAAPLPETVFAPEQAAQVVDFAALAVDGAHTMPPSVAGLVESSSNLGVLRADADEVSAQLNARSSQEALLVSLCDKHRRLATLCGFDSIALTRNADAWPVDVNAKLPALMQEVYRQQTGEELQLVYVHAGLECGTFARMKEGLEMISIGPTLHDVHSPRETLELNSIAPFYRLVEGTLERLSEGD